MNKPIETQKRKLFPCPLFDLFNSTSALITDLLLMLRELDYSETDIAKRTELNRRTISNELKRLSEKKVIKLTRKIGKANMYMFNDIEDNKWLKQYYDQQTEQDDESEDICTPPIKIENQQPLQQILQQLQKEIQQIK